MNPRLHPYLPFAPAGQSAPGGSAPGGALLPAVAGTEAGPWRPEQATATRCPLCRQPVAAGGRHDSRCPACHSPLAALPAPGDGGHDALGRRGAVRRDQGHVALLRVGWPSEPVPVRWRDLSLTGLSFFSPEPLAEGQPLRLADQAIDLVAQVVGCRAQGRVHVVHARLLTALLLQPTGVFVSAQA